MVTLAKRRRLGDLLLEAGLLDDQRLKTALAEQRKWGGKLGRTLVELGFVDERAMVEVLAQQLHLRTVDLDTAQLQDKIANVLRLDLAERYGVFPVSASDAGMMEVATSDPTNIEALQELEFATNQKVVPVVTTASGIDRAIRRYYFGESTTATTAATPASLGVTETLYELDQLLGESTAAPAAKDDVASSKAASAPSTPAAPAPSPDEPAQDAPAPDSAVDLTEVALLREQVDTLEKIVASQVRSLRSLLELLIESGLVAREEYLDKLHRPD